MFVGRMEGTWSPQRHSKLTAKRDTFGSLSSSVSDEMSAELQNRSMWANGKKEHAATPPRCSHASTHRHICTHCFGSKLPNTLTLLLISSLHSSKVAQQQKAPLSQAWQSAIFNPLRMIIEFPLIPFQRRLPSNAPITTLVTSDPAPVPHACASTRDWMSKSVLNGVTQQHSLLSGVEMELTEKSKGQYLT